jgi:hypothetical protein
MISRERGSRSRGLRNPDGVTDTPRVLYQGFLATADIIPALCALRFPSWLGLGKFPAWPDFKSDKSLRPEWKGSKTERRAEKRFDGVTLGLRSLRLGGMGPRGSLSRRKVIRHSLGDGLRPSCELADRGTRGSVPPWTPSRMCHPPKDGSRIADHGSRTLISRANQLVAIYH